MKTKATTVLALLLAVALAGCTGGDTRTQAASAEDLEGMYLHVTCTISIDGVDDGIHADLAGPCKGELKDGTVSDASYTWTGHDDNLGTIRPNREAEMGGFVVFADDTNSVTDTVVYNVEDGQAENATVTIRAELVGGFGTYETCFNFGGYKDSAKFLPGLQETPDNTLPFPKCVKHEIKAGGGWFS